MKLSLIAMTTCAGLLTTVAPATGGTTVDVPIKIKNCASCMINAVALVGDSGWSQMLRLRHGAGVLQVPSRVSDFQIHIRKGEWDVGAPNSAALIVMAYTGEEVGSRISNKRSRTSRSGFVCVPLSEGLVIRARVKLIKTPHYRGWRQDHTFSKKYVRAWASPTLPSVPDVYDNGPWPTDRGAAGTQQVICGD